MVSQQANAVRRELLKAMREGSLEGDSCLGHADEPTSAEFKEAVELAFCRRLAEVQTSSLS